MQQAASDDGSLALAEVVIRRQGASEATRYLERRHLGVTETR